MVVGVLGAASLLTVGPGTAAAAAPAAGCSVLTSSVYQASKPTGYTFLSTSIPAYSASRDRYGFTIKQGISMRASTVQKAGTVPILRMYNAHTRSFRWVAAGSPNARAASLAGFRTQGREFYAMPGDGAGCLRVYRYSRGPVDQMVVEGSNETSVRAAGWVRREGLFSIARGLSNIVPVTRGVPVTKPKPPAPSPVKPGALRVIKGDLIASTPGQVINRVDVRGSIFVRAANVTIRNSIVRGGTNAALRRYAPLVDNRAGHARLLVEDTVIAESTPSAWNASGIGGSNFTARRVRISGQVDSINITGSNVTVENSTLGRNVYYANHWQSQKSGGTHNDNIQVLRGDNITLRGNIMTGSHSLGLVAAPEWGTMRNLLVENNFIDNGECSSKFSDKGGNAASVTVRNNVFGGHQRSWKCYIVVAGGVKASITGNVVSNGSTPGATAAISSARSSTPVKVIRGQY